MFIYINIIFLYKCLGPQLSRLICIWYYHYEIYIQTYKNWLVIEYIFKTKKVCHITVINFQRNLECILIRGQVHYKCGLFYTKQTVIIVIKGTSALKILKHNILGIRVVFLLRIVDEQQFKYRVLTFWRNWVYTLQCPIT